MLVLIVLVVLVVLLVLVVEVVVVVFLLTACRLQRGLHQGLSNVLLQSIGVQHLQVVELCQTMGQKGGEAGGRLHLKVPRVGLRLIILYLRSREQTERFCRIKSITTLHCTDDQTRLWTIGVRFNPYNGMKLD